MAKRDINKGVFDAGTKLKLALFRDFFKAWLPVFIYRTDIERIYIYDMFAGSGKDSVGNLGSPLMLLNEVKKYCDILAKNGKKVIFGFNEGEEDKADLLSKNIIQYLGECKNKCSINNCYCENSYHVKNEDFALLFNNPIFQKNLYNKKYAKFLLIDQYGFKQVDDIVFRKLIDAPITDFLFFISSTRMKQFKDTDCVTFRFQNAEIFIDKDNPKKSHEEVANYFRNLIPAEKEYYLHPFTIRKKGNYNGIIFGSNHSFGMEKFISTCWKYDTFAGESNWQKDYGEIFRDTEPISKIDNTKQKIKELILASEITNNKDGLLLTLRSGCEPKIFYQVVKELKNRKLIEIIGQSTNKATSIHNVPIYTIKVLQQ